MNNNLFERKEFLDKSWISQNSPALFTNVNNNNKTVVQINLLRATANEAEMFKTYLNNLSSKIGNEIIIDLSECDFIDSTFLNSILNFNKNYKSKVELVVKDIRQMTIFKITKLDKIFNIYPSLEIAVAN
jgi:anti-anti-sigma factor